MIDTFKALSEESRLRILALIIDRDMCVCDIEAVLKMTQSNVSRHLSALKNSGIVESNKKAQWAFYKVSDRFKIDYLHLWLLLSEKFNESPYVELRKKRDENLNCDENIDFPIIQAERSESPVY